MTALVVLAGAHVVHRRWANGPNADAFVHAGFDPDISLHVRFVLWRQVCSIVGCSTDMPKLADQPVMLSVVYRYTRPQIAGMLAIAGGLVLSLISCIEKYVMYSSSDLCCVFWRGTDGVDVDQCWQRRL